jgi:F-box-like
MSFPGPDSLRPPLDAPVGRHKNDNACLFPDEVCAVIASFLPDAATACRCSAVCKAFYRSIQHNDGLWKNLAGTVWKIAPVPHEPPIRAEATADAFYRSEYQRCHELDMKVVHIVFPMATFLTDRDTLHLQLKRDFQWGENRPEGERLIRLFPVATDIANIAARHNDPVQALDGLRSYALIDPSRMNVGDGGAAIERLFVTIHCVAQCVLDDLYYGHVFRQWMQLLYKFESLPPKPHLYDADSHAAMTLFLEGLQLISQLLLDDQEFLHPSPFGPLLRQDAIAKRVQVYGGLLRPEVNTQRGGEFSPVEAVETLSALFFHDWGFVGNVVSSDLSNFSVYSALTTRKGNGCSRPFTHHEWLPYRHEWLPYRRDGNKSRTFHQHGVF